MRAYVFVMCLYVFVTIDLFVNNIIMWIAFPIGKKLTLVECLAFPIDHGPLPVGHNRQ